MASQGATDNPDLDAPAICAACWCGVTTGDEGIDTRLDEETGVGFCIAEGWCALISVLLLMPIDGIDPDDIAAAPDGVEVDEDLIAAMMFGGSGTGDCLEGTGAAGLPDFAVAFVAPTSPRTACLRGGGGFDSPGDGTVER